MRAWRRGGPRARTRGARRTRLERRQRERRGVEMGPRRTERGGVSSGPSYAVRAPSPGFVRCVNPFTIKSRDFLECGTQTPGVSPSTLPC